MADIDELQIKVNASAKGANAQLENLANKLMALKSSLNGLDATGIKNIARGLQNFTKAAVGLKDVKTTDFTRLTKNLEKISEINTQEIENASKSILSMSGALGSLSGIDFSGSKKAADLCKGLGKLNGVDIDKVTEGMPQLAKSIKNMMSTLSKTKSIDKQVISMTNVIGRLSDKKISSAITSLPQLADALRKFMTELQTMPEVSDKIVRITEAVSKLVGTSGRIRNVSNAFDRMQSSGNRTSSMMKNLTSNLRRLIPGLNNTKNSSKSLIHYLGSLYANFWMLGRAGTFLKDAVQSSMDYIEEFNYFNVTFGKIGDEWSKQWKKYGYENAEAYGESFQGRVTELINKMSGFKMQSDGTLTDSGIKNLGLDVTQLTNYSAGIAQVTNSLGLTGEASTVTSKALSMLAGDMSSFRNLDMSTVMTNFQSGLIGQSRALYKYGIDITNATLQTYAYNNGISKSVSEMTQAEKMQLRMLAILDQSKVAWGDLANTINSPSNQLRLLQNNFKALARTIGNMFLPIVAKVLPYVNGLVIAIRRLFEWTASMLGMDLSDIIGNSSSGYSDAFEDLEEDADDASSAIDDTTDSAKKLNKQLQGFDELNNLTSSSSKDKSDGDSGTGAPIDLTDKLSDALADYEKVWSKAYEDMTSDAEKFADKLTKLFKNAWTSGDGTDIGTAIATWINKGISWINSNTDKLEAGLTKLANIMATSFNGFVSTLDWSGLGKAIGNSIGAYLKAETHFFDTVNWVNLGSALAKSLNSFFDTEFLEKFGANIGAKMRAAIETAFGFVTTFNFDELGEHIGNGINEFFNKMGKVNKQTGLNGWQELGKSISDSIKGIATTITTALETVNWEKVGQSIADFISSIDWTGVVWSLAKIVGALIKALGTTLTEETKKNPVAGVVTIALLGFALKSGWKKLLSTFLGGKIAGSKIGVGISRVSAVIKNWAANKKDMALSKLTGKLGKIVSGLNNTVKKVKIKVKDWAISSVKSIATRIKDKIPNIVDGAKKIAIKVKDWIVNASEAIANKIKNCIPSSVSSSKKVNISANWQATGVNTSLTNSLIGALGGGALSLVVTCLLSGDDTAISAVKSFLGNKEDSIMNAIMNAEAQKPWAKTVMMYANTDNLDEAMKKVAQLEKEGKITVTWDGDTVKIDEIDKNINNKKEQQR